MFSSQHLEGVYPVYPFREIDSRRHFGETVQTEH